MSDPRQVIEEALRLPVRERSSVIAELLASLMVSLMPMPIRHGQKSSSVARAVR